MYEISYFWFLLHNITYRKRKNLQDVTVSIAFDDNRRNTYDNAFPLLASRGIVATFYVVADYIRDFSLNRAYMGISELKCLQDHGCEIASHSKTHPHFTRISDDQIRSECSVSRQVLENQGFQVNNFAYPYGDTNDHVDSIVRSYYRSGRSAYAPPYIMKLPAHQFRLSAMPGELESRFKESHIRIFANSVRCFRLVDQAYGAKDWIIIFFHNVVPNPKFEFETGTQEFATLLDYLMLKGVKTVTVNQALDDLSPRVSTN